MNRPLYVLNDNFDRKIYLSVITFNVSINLEVYRLDHHRSRWYAITFNSSPPSAAYIRQWIWSALVQIMACRIIGAKPLSKSKLGYCQLDHYEQTSVKFYSKYKMFHSRKCVWKYRLQNGYHFVQGDELTALGHQCVQCWVPKSIT